MLVFFCAMQIIFLNFQWATQFIEMYEQKKKTPEQLDKGAC